VFPFRRIVLSPILPPHSGATKDIDLLFVGSLTPKRKAILEHVQKHFPNSVVTSAFGDEMVALINRAKIVLNIHAIDSTTTETVSMKSRVAARSC
jgi:hypothetical protein